MGCFFRPLETYIHLRKENKVADLDVVMEKLQSFETADDLADYFRDYGIVGQPRDAMSCAISKFVVEETGLGGIVTNMSSVAHYADDEQMQQIDSYVHTSAMRNFVVNFDGGEYPDLIQKGYEPYVPTYEVCTCETCT